MSATTSTLTDDRWLDLITECRRSGLTDRQWCQQNGIPTSTFYYHIRLLRRKACAIPSAANTPAQKQDIVQIPIWEDEAESALSLNSGKASPAICLEMHGVRVEIHDQAGETVIRNTLRALGALC